MIIEIDACSFVFSLLENTAKYIKFRLKRKEKKKTQKKPLKTTNI